MEGMCLKFTPVLVRHLLGHLSMFGPTAGTSWTHIASPNSPNGCHISHRTCLTNPMGFISHHRLLIPSGIDTHTHIYANRQSNFKKPGVHWPVHVPGLKT